MYPSLTKYLIICWVWSSLVSATLLAQQTPYSHGDPTSFEQYMLELINYARTNPVGEGAFLNNINTSYAQYDKANYPLLLYKSARRVCLLSSGAPPCLQSHSYRNRPSPFIGGDKL